MSAEFHEVALFVGQDAYLICPERAETTVAVIIGRYEVHGAAAQDQAQVALYHAEHDDAASANALITGAQAAAFPGAGILHCNVTHAMRLAPDTPHVIRLIAQHTGSGGGLIGLTLVRSELA